MSATTTRSARKTSKAVGIRRLLKLADFLETSVPNKRFDMGRWADGSELTTAPSCGTSACALGWATVPFRRDLGLQENRWWGGFEYLVVDKKTGDTRPFVIAQEFFGLDADTADELFGCVAERDDRTPKTKAKHIRRVVEQLQKA